MNVLVQMSLKDENNLAEVVEIWKELVKETRSEPGAVY